jgi:mono/diheme cytochrome c family protein
MKHAEVRARLLISTLAVAALGIPFLAWSRTPLIHARTPENGGWSTQALTARVGEPLHLRLTSDDVVHGFAVGQLDMQSVDLLPGKVVDVTLLFSKPGTYTFYCPRWCGLNHWRMRGTIEVSGAQPAAASVVPPMYVALGLDLDASRTLPQALTARPIADILSRQLSGELSKVDAPAYYRSHSPYEAWQDMRSDVASLGQSDAQVWNRVAALWRSSTNEKDLAEGQRLFSQNCAACHGPQGAGNGVFADDLIASGEASRQGMTDSAMGMQRPADFTDPARLLSASPALLQGKILRGGMGTGMPSWGAIFTEQQTWDLVAYLYTFQFTYR